MKKQLIISSALLVSSALASTRPLTLEDRVTILERRVDSLEAPSESDTSCNN